MRLMAFGNTPTRSLTHLGTNSGLNPAATLTRVAGADQLCFGNANPYGLTEAMKAVHRGDNAQLETILTNRPEQVSKTDVKGQNLLAHAMNHNNMEGLKIIIRVARSSGVDVPGMLNTMDEEFYTPLAWAVESGKKDIVALFLENGAHAFVPEAGLNSPDKLAELNGWPEIAALLKGTPHRSE